MARMYVVRVTMRHLTVSNQSQTICVDCLNRVCLGYFE